MASPCVSISILTISAPWCFIGKKHLDLALAELGRTDFDIHWRPYQLYPQIPMEGVDREAFMKARFGESRGGEGFKRIAEVGREAGIEFDFRARKTIPNTFHSHRLVEYAGEKGVQHQLVEALMSAGFEQGRDIGSPTELAAIGAEVGLEQQHVLDMLTSNAYRDEVHEGLEYCLNAGIRGVPLFRLEDGEIIQGAQPVAVFRMILGQV